MCTVSVLFGAVPADAVQDSDSVGENKVDDPGIQNLNEASSDPENERNRDDKHLQIVGNHGKSTPDVCAEGSETDVPIAMGNTMVTSMLSHPASATVKLEGDTALIPGICQTVQENHNGLRDGEGIVAADTSQGHMTLVSQSGAGHSLKTVTMTTTADQAAAIFNANENTEQEAADEQTESVAMVTNISDRESVGDDGDLLPDSKEAITIGNEDLDKADGILLSADGAPEAISERGLNLEDLAMMTGSDKAQLQLQTTPDGLLFVVAMPSSGELNICLSVMALRRKWSIMSI